MRVATQRLREIRQGTVELTARAIGIAAIVVDDDNVGIGGYRLVIVGDRVLEAIELGLRQSTSIVAGRMRGSDGEQLIEIADCRLVLPALEQEPRPVVKRDHAIIAGSGQIGEHAVASGQPGVDLGRRVKARLAVARVRGMSGARVDQRHHYCQNESQHGAAPADCAPDHAYSR